MQNSIVGETRQFNTLIEYAIPRVVREELADIDNYINKKLKVKWCMHANAEFIARVLAWAPDTPRAYVSSYGSDVSLSIYIKVQGFTLAAAPELGAYLERLSAFYENPPTSYDSPTAGQRGYTFTLGDTEELLIPLTIIAELEENSVNCQRIITGVEKVKSLQYVEIDQPVYAFKC